MSSFDEKKWDEMRLRHVRDAIDFYKEWLAKAEAQGEDEENLAVIKRCLQSMELEEFKLKQKLHQY